MSKPPVIPEKSTSGIAVDPRTLDRVVPESRRPDGSVRKTIRIRPGFTPQEDVTRFRGTRQTQMDRNALPKGHILGWVAPSNTSRPGPPEAGGPASKTARKNGKRKEKRDKKKEDIIRANWEEDDVAKDADGAPNWAETAKPEAKQVIKDTAEGTEQVDKEEAGGDAEGLPPQAGEEISNKLENLEIR